MKPDELAQLTDEELQAEYLITQDEMQYHRNQHQMLVLEFEQVKQYLVECKKELSRIDGLLTQRKELRRDQSQRYEKIKAEFSRRKKKG